MISRQSLNNIIDSDDPSLIIYLLMKVKIITVVVGILEMVQEALQQIVLLMNMAVMVNMKLL